MINAKVNFTDFTKAIKPPTMHIPAGAKSNIRRLPKTTRISAVENKLVIECIFNGKILDFTGTWPASTFDAKALYRIVSLLHDKYGKKHKIIEFSGALDDLTIKVGDAKFQAKF